MILKVNRVSKRFNAFEALKNVSFEVEAGHIVAILGPSGSGKTTLLRCIAGFEQLSTGTVDIFPGQDDRVLLDTETRHATSRTYGKVGFVFQDLQLWPHMTILDNLIVAPMRVRKISKGSAVAKASGICERLDISEQLYKYPRDLSTGQQQRAAIARTLAMEPHLILLDEITSALDPERVREIANIVKDLAHSGITILMVSHQVALAKWIADKILFLSEGMCIYNGPPAALNDLKDLPPETRRFVQADSYLEE